MNSSLTEREPTKEELSRHEAVQRLEYSLAQINRAILYAKSKYGHLVIDALMRATDAIDDATASAGEF